MKPYYKKNLLWVISIVFAFSASIAESQELGLLANEQSSKIIELVIAGIVAAALIIAVLVLFLGRWAGRYEKNKIKHIRFAAEKEKNKILSVSNNLHEYERNSSQILQTMQKHATESLLSKQLVDEHTRNIVQSAEHIKAQEEALIQTTNSMTSRMNKIQSYWDSQLKDTAKTIHDVQINLDKTLGLIDDDLDAMQQQKQLSQDLLQDFLIKHQEQSELINKHSNISAKVGQSLEKTFKESSHLVDLLKQHQESAEKSLGKFTEELTNYEEQAYEQFDSSFQVADLARQELTANIDESRVHIESMRRHEEQSRKINKQTQKNLEALDYSKIIKISNTLDSTQDLFTDIRDRVENTKKLLDELNDIETDLRTTKTDDTEQHDEPESVGNIDNVELNTNIYKMASGDNTPLSFFSKIKEKD